VAFLAFQRRLSTWQRRRGPNLLHLGASSPPPGGASTPPTHPLPLRAKLHLCLRQLLPSRLLPLRQSSPSRMRTTSRCIMTTTCRSRYSSTILIDGSPRSTPTPTRTSRMALSSTVMPPQRRVHHLRRPPRRRLRRHCRRIRCARHTVPRWPATRRARHCALARAALRRCPPRSDRRRYACAHPRRLTPHRRRRLHRCRSAPPCPRRLPPLVHARSSPPCRRTAPASSA
jgi:hypothetical protein